MELTDYRFMNALAKLAFVEEIWLFGSRARGDHSERSDIDLALLCPKASDQDWSKVLHIIEEADTLLKIDCIRFDSLGAEDLLKKNILQFKKVLYSKKGGLVDTVFWKDYFNLLGQAIERLSDLLHHSELDKNEYMQDAAIQRFEFVIELYWKVLKKILAYEKLTSTTPREVISQSFQFKLIDDEVIWLKMLEDRNNTSHVYKQEDAKRIFEHIKTYLPVFESSYAKLKSQYGLGS